MATPIHSWLDANETPLDHPPAGGGTTARLDVGAVPPDRRTVPSVSLAVSASGRPPERYYGARSGGGPAAGRDGGRDDGGRLGCAVLAVRRLPRHGARVGVARRRPGVRESGDRPAVDGAAAVGPASPHPTPPG